jgi:alpha-L-arabinofuranosidase
MSLARLSIWPALTGARIAPEIYGHQMEMVGRSVYDGIWVDRAARVPNEDGVRLDVLALLKHLRVPLLKWPGEDFANYYHWRDGVGTGGTRPRRVNVPWQQTEPNSFGLHEFMEVCEKLGCKPWLTCNGRTGTLNDAMGLAEYATFGGETERTRERACNGHPAPYEIPFWSLSGGGPLDGQALSSLSPESRAIESAIGDEERHTNEKYHKPTINNPSTPSITSFSHYFESENEMGGGLAAYEAACAGLNGFEAELSGVIGRLAYLYPRTTPAVALSGWGVWHAEATAESGLEQARTLLDGLTAASVYHLLNANAQHVKMATLSHAVNALHCLAVTEGADAHLTPTYHVVDMMRTHRGGRLLTQRLETPDFEISAPSTGRAEVFPALSTSASRTGKRVCLTVANRSYTEEIPIAVEIREAGISSLSGRLLHADAVTAENSFDRPKNVAPKRLKLTPDGNTFHDKLPPHSFASYSISLGQG